MELPTLPKLVFIVFQKALLCREMLPEKTTKIAGRAQNGKHRSNDRTYIQKHTLPPLLVLACKSPTCDMTSTIDQAWHDLKSSETAKTRANESRVRRILNRSGSKQVKSRSVRGIPSCILRKHHTEGLSFADLDSTVPGSPTSEVDQVGGADPGQTLGEETGGKNAFKGAVLIDRRKEEAAKPYERLHKSRVHLENTEKPPLDD